MIREFIFLAMFSGLSISGMMACSIDSSAYLQSDSDQKLDKKADLEQKLFVFGDSLLDNGNFMRTFPIAGYSIEEVSEGVALGRFSNGKTYIENLADHWQIKLEPSYAGGTNYAVGAAHASPENESSTSILNMPTIVEQVEMASSSFSESDRFYIGIGGNDMIGAMEQMAENRPNVDQEKIIENAVAAIVEAIEKLKEKNASTVLVANLPNLGHSPEIAALAEVNETVSSRKKASELTVKFNAKLKEELAANFDDSVVIIDIYNIFESIYQQSSILGFVNRTDACFLPTTGKYSDNCSPEIADSFIYFDSIHPSAGTNRLIEAGIQKFLHSQTKEQSQE